MISTALLLATVIGQAEASAARFFPLNPGDRFIFEESADGGKKVFTDVVGEPMEMNGRTVHPVDTLFQGRQSLGKVYYAIEGERVLVAGIDPSGALANPYPILVASTTQKSFVWSGELPVPNGNPEPMTLSGESKAGKQVNLFGKRRDTIVITLASEVAGMVTLQTSTYAEGLGLVEMVEEVGKKRLKRTRKLMEYQPAKKGDS